MSKVAEGQARKDLTTSLEKLKQLVESSTPAKAAAPAKKAAPGGAVRSKTKSP